MKHNKLGFKTALRASLAAVLLMTMLLSTALPAGAIAGTVGNATDPMGTAGNVPATADTNGAVKMLQFTSSGHVLGFSPGGVMIASGSHMLKTEFIGSNAVAPQADSAVPAESSAAMASPLNRVTYHNAWDGVTVAYEAREGAIVESIYYVDAVADMIPGSNIRLGYNRPVSLDRQGNLVIAYESGTMVESAPLAWQEIDGQRMPVTVAYKLYGERELGFSLAGYLPGVTVVIDPTLTWNTFLGGSGSDGGYGIAVGGNGYVYVVGKSNATWGASPVRAYTAGGSGWDACVAGLDSSGKLIWNTFLGGSDDDYGNAIAVDGGGNVYVAGTSLSTWGYPVNIHTPFSYDDAFAAKLNSATGVLVWNTFMGSNGDDSGTGIAVDTGGNVYVAGTSKFNWGTPVQPHWGSNNGDLDSFAARLNSTTGVRIWNTFLGGSGNDYGYATAVDGNGHVYVVGKSDASWGAPVRNYTGGYDAFAATLDGDTGVRIWNTFLGCSGTDEGTAIAADGGGNVYVTGWGGLWGAPVRAFSGGYDVFAAKLNSSGALTWNTFLGGSGWDEGHAIAVDGSGNVYVAGKSLYNTWGSPWLPFSSPASAFAAGLDSSGHLDWNTFLRGGGSGIAVGNNTGNVYLAGYTDANWGAPVHAYTSGLDIFVVKIAAYNAPPPPAAPTLVSPASGATTENLTPLLDWNNSAGAGITYGVQVSTASTFATDNLTVNVSSGLTTSDYIVPGGLNWNTTYYWHARAINGSGSSSAWSASRTFKTAWGQPAPTNLIATPVSATRINLAWTDNSTGATGFKIERKKLGGAWAQVATVGTDNHTYSNTTGLTANTQYFYRVRAYLGTTLNTGYSNEDDATTLPLPPAAPTLVSLASGATTENLTPRLDWNNSPGDNITYGVQVSTASTFATGTLRVDMSDLPTSDYTVPGDNLTWNTTYYWRANAANLYHSTSRWSATRTFKTAWGQPRPTNLTATENSSTRIDLAWTDNSTGEAGFKIERKKAGTTTYAQVATVGENVTTYSNSTGLTANTQYFYRVRAYLGATLNSAYSDNASATTAPLAPTPVAPAINAINQSVTPVLDWSDTAGAVSYRVQVSTASTFATMAVNESVTGATNSTYTVASALNPNTPYFWRVNATNASLSTSAWSLVRSFTTAGP
jgi:phosphodiesterase/alkaline phosphatase D-like protein